MITAAVMGGSGYIGGELIRLLLGHPRVELVAVTSNRLAGKRVDGAHPNLRGLTGLTFTPPERLGEFGGYDVLFLAVPHGHSMTLLATVTPLATTVIDLSGDFRLTDPACYERYYHTPHAVPDAIGTFASGLPELHRDRLRSADRISVPGCMATAAILAARAPATDGLLAGDVWVDARTGSSGAGAGSGAENRHAERSGALRVYAPFGHRHEAEISQALGLPVSMTVTGVEAVRGVQVLCRAPLAEGADERELRRSYRAHFADEPFVRVVAQRRGRYRLPEPKILSGSNFCDVGFAVAPDGGYALLLAALDNLVKGGAGGAVQSMNVRYGLPERLGLEFCGIHPG